jgi:GNAT superfamily N-acetyltransferase
MLEQWFRPLHLPMTLEQFHLLPRHSAYKYEYVEGQAWISPRPRMFNGLLELASRTPREPAHVHNSQLTFRAMESGDWQRFPKLFASAFESVPPFCALNEKERLHASTQCLHQASSGGDGPVLENASFVAEIAPGKLAGAIIVTLIPKREEGEWWDGLWDNPPATDDARRLLGRPHLTWVFVAPLLARHGIGSALLDRAVKALIGLGYNELASTFLIGNDSTVLWHWRNGFRLMAYPGMSRAKTIPET